MNLHFMLLTEKGRGKKKGDRSSKNQKRTRNNAINVSAALFKGKTYCGKIYLSLYSHQWDGKAGRDIILMYIVFCYLVRSNNGLI